MSDPVAEGPILAFYALLFILVIRRSVLLARGVRVSPLRLAVQGGSYLFLFLITIVLDVAVLPGSIFAIDALVLGAGAVLGTLYVQRVTEFDVRADGGWTYRLGILLPMIYLALFAIRVVVEVAVLPSPFGSSGALSGLSTTQQWALGGVDTLFALSAGLLVGRSIGVYLAYLERLRNLPPVPPIPPPPPLSM